MLTFYRDYVKITLRIFWFVQRFMAVVSFVVTSHIHTLNIKAVLAFTIRITCLLRFCVYSFHNVLIPVNLCCHCW